MGTHISKQFIAVRAVIVRDSKILLIRESMSYEGGANKGKYDFPGGKVKLGEALEDAVQREVVEEVGSRIDIGRPFHVGEWRPVVRDEQLQIIGIFFLCTTSSNNIRLGADHDQYVWMTTAEALELDLIEETRAAIHSLVDQKLL